MSERYKYCSMLNRFDNLTHEPSSLHSINIIRAMYVPILYEIGILYFINWHILKNWHIPKYWQILEICQYFWHMPINLPIFWHMPKYWQIFWQIWISANKGLLWRQIQAYSFGWISSCLGVEEHPLFAFSLVIFLCNCNLILNNVYFIEDL